MGCLVQAGSLKWSSQELVYKQLQVPSAHMACWNRAFWSLTFSSKPVSLKLFSMLLISPEGSCVALRPLRQRLLNILPRIQQSKTAQLSTLYPFRQVNLSALCSTLLSLQCDQLSILPSPPGRGELYPPFMVTSFLKAGAIWPQAEQEYVVPSRAVDVLCSLVELHIHSGGTGLSWVGHRLTGVWVGLVVWWIQEATDSC
jgi:hypothetical protein